MPATEPARARSGEQFIVSVTLATSYNTNCRGEPKAETYVLASTSPCWHPGVVSDVEIHRHHSVCQFRLYHLTHGASGKRLNGFTGGEAGLRLAQAIPPPPATSLSSSMPWVKKTPFAAMGWQCWQRQWGTHGWGTANFAVHRQRFARFTAFYVY